LDFVDFTLIHSAFFTFQFKIVFLGVAEFGRVGTPKTLKNGHVRNAADHGIDADVGVSMDYSPIDGVEVCKRCLLLYCN
jgi:hypothetical protein